MRPERRQPGRSLKEALVYLRDLDRDNQSA